MWEFLQERQHQFLYNAWQHAYLVFLCVLVATIIAVALAILVTRFPRIAGRIDSMGVANTASAIGLTLPSFALVGLLLPPLGVGATLAFVCVCFYAILPILRNAVVGLAAVDPVLVESARGMGMGEVASMVRIRLPLAWPVILAGIRVSAQMSFGVAAIAAYALGPGLGGYIFTGLAQNGGANALNYALSGTIGIIIIALIFDFLLLLLGRATTSKGIRV